MNAGFCLGFGLALIAGTAILAVDQIKIDAHRVEVTGTITEVYRHYKRENVYYATYEYNGQIVESNGFSIPWEAAEFDVVCIEIDSTTPERARACGERLDFETFLGLLMGCGFLVTAALKRLKTMPADSGVLGSWLRKRRTSAGTSVGTKIGV